MFFWCTTHIFQKTMRLRVFTLIALGVLVAGRSRAQTDTSTGSIITSQPAVFDSSTKKAYVVDPNRGAVSVIDIASTGIPSHPIRSIYTGDAPIAISLNPLTSRIYVANHGSGTVSVIDVRSDQLIATIKVDPLPYSIAVNQKTNQVFVSSVYSNALKIIDGTTNAVTSLKSGSYDAMAINSNAGLLYLMSYESSDLTVLNLNNRTFSKLPMGATHPWAFARNPVTSILYVTRIGNADVVAYNEQSHTSSIIKTGNYPCAIAINSRTNRVYVLNYADETVTVIDGAANRVLATLPVGNHPQAIAVDEDANQAYVANVHGNTLTVIDGSKNLVSEALPAGKNPYGLVVAGKSGAVVTANEGEPSFTVLSALEGHAKERSGGIK